MIREGTPADFGPATELMNAVWPTRVGSERGLTHAFGSEPPTACRRYWLVDGDNGVHGWASACIDYESASRAGSLLLCVADAARRQGLGSALFSAAEAHLAEVGATAIAAGSDDSEAARRFATARGFRHTHTIRISGVDPGSIEPPAPVLGVELARLVDLDPASVFTIDSEAMLDIPGEVAMDDVELDQWLRDYWTHPDMDLESSVAAVVEGTPVSFTLVRVAPNGRAVNDMTGTLRAFRGRGLALLCKRAALVNLARRGIDLVTTDNDETNAPMLAVNERLGYRPVGARLSWYRP